MFAKTSETPRSTMMLAQRDSRAEGGVRHVRVTRSDILIVRRFAGISMRILAPIASYRGVALAVEPGKDGGVAFRLSLAHADPDFDVVLAETRDGQAVAADWRDWAAYLDLPRLSQEDGETRAIEEERSDDAAARRRPGGVAKRRPRFLARRQRGEPARAGVVFEGEREIVCYE